MKEFANQFALNVLPALAPGVHCRGGAYWYAARAVEEIRRQASATTAIAIRLIGSLAFLDSIVLPV